MYRRILVPLDGSRFSENAIPRALAIGGEEPSRVHLVAVAGSSIGTEARTAVRAPAEAEDRTRAIHAADRYLEGVEERLGALAPEAQVSRRALPPGNVAHSLRREIEEESLDLVVMSTHGRGGVRRAWLGSVADGLIRSSPVPVLLVRPEGEGADSEEYPDPLSEPAAGPFRHVLVPVDRSPDSADLVRHAVGVARGGAKVTLLHVVPPVPAGAYPYMTLPAREDESAEELVRTAEEELESLAAGIRGKGISVDVKVVAPSEPVPGIFSVAEEGGVDVIAMSTRGRGGVARLLLGSVADKVIRASRMPVLVYRPPEEQVG